MAALLFGGTALFAKWIPLSADVITFWRTVVAIVVVMIFCRIRRQSLRLERRRDVWFQIGLGAILGFHWFTYYASIQYSTVAIGITALFVAPVFSVLLESAMGHKRPDAIDLLLCGIVLIGVCCLVPNFDWENGYIKGVLLGLLSAVFLTLRQNLHRRSRAKNASGLVLLFYQLIGIGALFTFSGMTAEPVALQENWGKLLLLGVFFTAIPHFFNVSALRDLEAKTVLIITSLMLPYGMVLSALFLGEIPSARTLLGCALVLLAATAENLRVRRTRLV